MEVPAQDLVSKHDCFAWVSLNGFILYKRQVDLMLDSKPDTAHIHVMNILENKEKSESSSRSEMESSSGEEEASGKETASGEEVASGDKETES